MTSEMIPLGAEIINPRQLLAYDNLVSKKVPKSAKRTHPGKGGQTFTYVDHIWVTETLQNALGNMWSWEVEKWEVFQDSVIVSGKLTLHILANDTHPYNHKEPSRNPLIFNRVITEVGSYDIRKGMSLANTVASAASRALCRCAMRMFGLGIEFYKKDEDAQITPDQAWTSLKQFAIRQGVKWEKDSEFEKTFIAALKDKGITGATIVDNYGEAYKILAGLIGKVAQVEKMPEV